MSDPHRFPFTAMATDCELVLEADDAGQVRAGAEAAMAEVRRIERKYSRYAPSSWLSRLNAAAGVQAVPCDTETRALLDYADTLYRSSQGLFDITAGVLRQAWDFRTPRVPAAAELAAVRARIGWSLVRRDEGSVYLPQPGMEIDLGGFGKEYAADRAAAVLRQCGLQRGYVNLAGDLHVIGPRADGRPWIIGIRDPFDRDRLAASIPIMQGGLATSGDYERGFEIDGRRYGHVLNPRTGMPVSHWRSVSVLAANALMAGSCSTIAMLLEADGLRFLRDSGLDHLAIDRFGARHLPTDLDTMAGGAPSTPTPEQA